MSGNDTEPKPSRRAVRLVVGGLVAGAVLGGVAVAHAGEAGSTAPVPPKGGNSQPSDETSIRNQFEESFTPGRLDENRQHSGAIMIPPK
jgi:hypothetical protein